MPIHYDTIEYDGQNITSHYLLSFSVWNVFILHLKFWWFDLIWFDLEQNVVESFYSCNLNNNTPLIQSWDVLLYRGVRHAERYCIAYKRGAIETQSWLRPNRVFAKPRPLTKNVVWKNRKEVWEYKEHIHNNENEGISSSLTIMS